MLQVGGLNGKVDDRGAGQEQQYAQDWQTVGPLRFGRGRIVLFVHIYICLLATSRHERCQSTGCLFFSGLRAGLVKSLRYFLPEECLKPSSVWTKDSHAKTRKSGSILTQRRKRPQRQKEAKDSHAKTQRPQRRKGRNQRRKDAQAQRRKRGKTERLSRVFRAPVAA
jgi:hypothetical protein